GYIYRSELKKGVHASTAATPLDPRAQQYLTAGEAALLQGDLDTAKTNFDRASGVAEKDPRVLLPEARLATIRADVPWLKQRLLAPAGAVVPANAQAEIAANKTLLDDLAAQAKKAADDAVAASPDDPAALRVKVDALRIAGDRDAARALVGRVATNASQPDTAYVLGALDLAELDPPWSVVLERLRTAAAGEAGLGRARAALAYGLARSGNVAQARQEADRLAALAHPPPLVPQLRAYIDGAQAAASTDGGVAGVVGTAPVSVDVSKLPSAANPTANGGGSGGGALSSDPRTLLSQADTARQKKDFPRSRMLYEAALAKNPNDSEALSGLGDVSHDEKDLQGAEAFYKRAIGVNPTFLPALIGLADATWDLGDHAGAQKQYKEITDRFPEGSYSARVKQRSSDAPAPTETPTAATPADPPANQ
ncbi:MAG: tetratricopeptide repeat protein, partial [Polyangiaceae bacterium]